MASKRELFIKHVGQTGLFPLGLEIEHAEGMYIYDTSGKAYLDLNSGISVSSLGHRHPKVVSAIKAQVDKYMHTMVYGEHIQSPQVAYAELLSSKLDQNLNSIYFLNSGSETIELAMKLSRRFTNRYQIISCSNAYHGSTLGAESLRSDSEFKRAFMPGIPGVRHINFNDFDDLNKISHQTACVILEPVQAESGVIPPKDNYLQAVKEKCKEVGALFVLDEIQTGFGRTGHLFAHQKYAVVPDILLIAKSMGGGMPIGACVSSKEIMSSITANPSLGHITTFGGHPVCVSAALATLETLSGDNIISQVLNKEQKFKELLHHPIIREVRSSGLMMSVTLSKRKYLKHVVNKTIELGGLIDYFLFNNRCFRLAPPLIISEAEIEKACAILKTAMDFAQEQYR